MSIDVKEASFESASWFNALSLAERAGMLDRFSATTLDTDMDRGSKRLAQWRSQLPFNTVSQFGRRLECDRLTEEQFVKLLGEKPESLRARCSQKPLWLAELQALFAEQSWANSSAPPREVPPGSSPLINNGRDRFRRGIESLARRHSLVPFDPDAAERMFLPHLLQEFAKVANRTTVLEVNVARLLGLLEGETAEERYRSFAERLQRPEVMLSLFEEYPVLARQLLIRIDQWVGFSHEFLNNLCADWEEIQRTFSDAGDLGKLSSVSLGAGDTHRNGRSVVIASFSNGAKLVYKPRSLSVDVHYGQLLEWLNGHGDHPEFRTLKTLDRRTHGWQEFVAFETCTAVEQVDRFYRRLGGLLALLYALEATDFHFENLIAAGEHPVLVDLEALLHPRIQADFSALPAAEVMSNSVIRVGLLPQRMWLGAEPEGFDLSGVGGTAGQLTPFELPTLEGIGTDEIRVVRKRMPIAGSHNRPRLNEDQVNAESYVESVVSGFTSVYKTILDHRQELTVNHGRIAAFADDEVRVVLRPTRTYGLLLTESFHPDVLRNALDRDRLFDRLWAEVEYRPYLSRLIASEQAELRRGDIPAFYTRPNSRDLWAGTGDRIADFFEVTSSGTVAQRIAAFCEQDLDRQIWFIRASMTSLNSGLGHEKWRGYKPASDVRPAEKHDLIAEARELGDRLEMLAIRSLGSVSWIGVVMVNDRAWSLLPLGDDLYGGNLGIALFLGYLGALTGVERYTELARCALAATRRQPKTETAHPQPSSIGGFSGKGGVIYVLSHLGALWNEAGLLDEAEEVARGLAPLIEQDLVLDVIGGAAGCIAGLESLNRVRSSDVAVTAAAMCAERLLATAIPSEGGVAWPGVIEVAKPLTGFSHGAAGIARSLLAATSMTGDRRFRDAALSAIEYERAVFLEEEQNWPDFRTGSARGESRSPGSILAWCHGAPGIGLGRLASLDHCEDPKIRSEINAALDATLKRGFGFNHSLCHGDLGNIDLLLEAGLKLDSQLWRERARLLAGVILESINSNGWLCGVPMGVETPGLMTGLAGIGYGLLRLADPVRVPSVLSLAPPPAARDGGSQPARFQIDKIGDDARELKR